MMEAMFEQDAVCFVRAPVSEVEVLVDAKDYYAAFYAAALTAEHSLLLAGWQLDTHTPLLRGKDAEAANLPVQFVPFLNALCERRPSLQVYLLAWDYSVVYAFEREWMQRIKLAMTTHEDIHFEYWTHPEAGGAFHQKYVVVDESVAFLGGLDICDARWDDRRHDPHNALRTDINGKPCKPFHDLQVAFKGQLVRELKAQFNLLWKQARGEPIEVRAPSKQSSQPNMTLRELSGGFGLPLRAAQAALSQTCFYPDKSTVVEVQELLTAAIVAAERVIYIETQYFTSRAIVAALRQRFHAEGRSKLSVVLVMPDGADSLKEDFVLGDRQRAVQFALVQLAARCGHQMRILMSTNDSEPNERVTTFIHSKLLIVDDQFLTVGSANLTNRSMQVDMELNFSVQADAGSKLSEDIARLRASLLAEHAGSDDLDAFVPLATLLETIDAACEDFKQKLRAIEVQSSTSSAPILAALFDPSGPMTAQGMEDALEDTFKFEEGLVKKTLRQAGQRLGVVDID